MPLRIELVPTDGLTPPDRAATIALCDQAFGTSLAGYFSDIGPGYHLLGRIDGALVSHLMWVPRWLQPGNEPLLHTAYIELVATAPEVQRQGHATALLHAVLPLIAAYDLAALSPATERLYLRLGWRYWEGSLAARKAGRLWPTPDDRLMVRALPGTRPLDLTAPLSVEWRRGDIW